MITSTEILGTEELLLERNSKALAVHQNVVAAGRAAVIALNKQLSNESDETALLRLDNELDAVIGRSLDEYARGARGLFSADDLALWTAKVARVPGSYVGRAAATGVPGSLLLLDALEEAEADEPGNRFVSLEDTLANGARYCQCGYASSRTRPEQLCQLCSGAVLNEWRAEEDRLLEGSPRLAADLEVVFDGLLDKLAGIHLAQGGVAASTSARRRAGDRGITRVNETRAAEIALLDLARWRDLCELNALGRTMAVTAHSKYWSRWGLGSARISTLAVVGASELQARMRKISGSRPAPEPTFFERLFSRR
ncbi:hypothetical protein C5B85_00915 [Pseudoclavibacter sp. AY1F1]|uniref:hypothetical protein n=1 Tax=Pseudoclavibacter sp. AY1F1 TaxID=2080583 RepID=UPI000CE91910|nr:hypothetical protein [Pseudoclavibacter sp. AY1F1]PPF46880.1 hypothetical protein C5B85_00915 [Pseudoclavibacter sp. AY1F1]